MRGLYGTRYISTIHNIIEQPQTLDPPSLLPSNPPRAIMRYLNILPLLSTCSTRLYRPSLAASTSCPRKKTLDPGSKIVDLPDRHNHAPRGATTRLHAPSLLTALVIHAPRLTSHQCLPHRKISLSSYSLFDVLTHTRSYPSAKLTSLECS
jgi:hypothetical protein